VTERGRRSRPTRRPGPRRDNRVDIGDSRIFELPHNLVEMGGPGHAAVRIRQDTERTSAATLLLDLGERDGDLGVAREARARIDYAILRRLGTRSRCRSSWNWRSG